MQFPEVDAKSVESVKAFKQNLSTHRHKLAHNYVWNVEIVTFIIIIVFIIVFNIFEVLLLCLWMRENVRE